MKTNTKHILIGLGTGMGVLSLIVVGTHFYFKNKKIDTSVFDSPDKKGSGKCMDKDFLGKYSELIKYIKRKYPYKYTLIMSLWRVNSGARSKKHNKKVGGVPNSAHVTCHAADLRAPFTWMREIIVEAAVKVGFTRIGIARTFVHIDSDKTKPQYVSWGYPKKLYNPFTRFKS